MPLSVTNLSEFILVFPYLLPLLQDFRIYSFQFVTHQTFCKRNSSNTFFAFAACGFNIIFP